jgi:hypothetical protein
MKKMMIQFKIEFYNKIKNWLKSFPFLVKIKQNFWDFFSTSRLNVNKIFLLYAPYSAGSQINKNQLTIEAINQVFPFLNSLVRFNQKKNSSLKKSNILIQMPKLILLV